MTIGEIIRHRRKKMEISGIELAERLGVKPTVVYRWETGEVYPSLLNAITLADFFGCSLDELVGRAPCRR